MAVQFRVRVQARAHVRTIPRLRLPRNPRARHRQAWRLGPRANATIPERKSPDMNRTIPRPTARILAASAILLAALGACTRHGDNHPAAAVHAPPPPSGNHPAAQR